MSDTTTPTPATDDGMPRYQKGMDRSLDRMFAATAEMRAAAVDLRETATDSEAIAAALVAGGWTPPTRDHAAADQAHRDDLARDVARLWQADYGKAAPYVGSEIAAALDRLSAAYGEKP